LTVFFFFLDFFFFLAAFLESFLLAAAAKYSSSLLTSLFVFMLLASLMLNSLIESSSSSSVLLSSLLLVSSPLLRLESKLEVASFLDLALFFDKTDLGSNFFFFFLLFLCLSTPQLLFPLATSLPILIDLVLTIESSFFLLDLLNSRRLSDERERSPVLERMRCGDTETDDFESSDEEMLDDELDTADSGVSERSLLVDDFFCFLSSTLDFFFER